MHQQPPQTPLFASTSAAKSFQVSGVSRRVVYGVTTDVTVLLSCLMLWPEARFAWRRLRIHRVRSRDVLRANHVLIDPQLDGPHLRMAGQWAASRTAWLVGPRVPGAQFPPCHECGPGCRGVLPGTSTGSPAALAASASRVS